MGTVNTESVREQLDNIENTYAKLSKAKKIDNDCRLLMQSMLLLIRLLVAVFMEKQTKKKAILI